MANATLISGQDIIAAPASVIEDAPGAENTHQQAFDEAQGVTLTSALAVDGGNIAAGTTVNSHMIFLNTPDSNKTEDLGVVWTFANPIIGVMSDTNGLLEAASNGILGAPGTIYPGSFVERGLDSSVDGYSVVGNAINVSMKVFEPGDWIRVVTQQPVPEPSSMVLGLLGMVPFFLRRKK